MILLSALHIYDVGKSLGLFFLGHWQQDLKVDNEINLVSSNWSSIHHAQISLANLILICIGATVERSPLWVVLEEAHRLCVLLMGSQIVLWCALALQTLTLFVSVVNL